MSSETIHTPRVTSNRSAPSTTVVPILVYGDVAKAIEWLCNAFDFSERLRFERNGVVSHAQLAFGDGAFMLGSQAGEYQAPRRGEVSQYVHVTVPDVEAHLARAQRHGVRILHGLQDTPFGERQYTAEDPEGHRWTFSQHIADVAPEQWGARSAV